MTSAGEAQRGIYIDFEGTIKHAPSVLGVLFHDETKGGENFKQYIIEKDLWPMTAYVPGKPHGYNPIATDSIMETLETIRQLSISDDRKIFAFGPHEIKEIRKFCEKNDEMENFDWWEKHLTNVQPLGRKWIKDTGQLAEFEKLWKQFPEDGKFTLVNFKRYLEHEVPKNLAKGKPAKGIGELREMLADKEGDISKVTSMKKRNWTRMMRHNWHDCQSTRLLTIQCATN